MIVEYSDEKEQINEKKTKRKENHTLPINEYFNTIIIITNLWSATQLQEN